MAFPKSKIISTSKFIQVFKESAENKQRFCFILGSGASVDSGILTGNDLEMRWMNELMFKDPSSAKSTLDCTPEVVDDETEELRNETRELAEMLYEDDEMTHRFAEIEKAWNDVRRGESSYLSSEYYFDLYKLRFHPNPQNGYRFLEQQMEGKNPSLGYRVLALLLTKAKKDNSLKDSNQHNLVITTNFDSLTEDALFIYTDKKPLVISHESLAAFIDSDTQRPIIAKVHRGLMFDPFNSPETTDHLEKEWHEALDYAFKTYTPVVIGYGGGDGSLMTYLQNSTSNKGIYWCYLDKYGLPNTTIQKFVRKRKGCLVKINGFDDLMNQLGNTLFPDEVDPNTVKEYLTDQTNRRMETYLGHYLKHNPDYDISKNYSPSKTADTNAPEKEAEEKPLTYLDHFNLAYAADEEGDLKLAIEEYTNALKKDPNRPIAYNNRGVSYTKSGKKDKAIADYSKAIELNPNYASAYYNRGNSYDDLGQHERAIQDYDKAIELDPNYTAAYNNRGISYKHLGQYERAIQDYDKAIELNPNSASAYFNRGNSYDDLGQHERAIQDYDKAIELDPNYTAAYNNRGISYKHLGQYERAIQDYDKAIELNPTHAEAYNNRAISYKRLGQYERAIQDYDKAIELNPNDADAYNNRGTAYHSQTKYEEAIKDYTKAIELNTNYVLAYHNRGNSHRLLGHYDQAIKDCTKAIELDPNCADAYRKRSYAYRDSGKVDLAEADEAKAAELEAAEKAAKS